jgi:hypothetical protein
LFQRNFFERSANIATILIFKKLIWVLMEINAGKGHEELGSSLNALIQCQKFG